MPANKETKITNCKTCNSEVYYTTKRPVLCATCKAKEPPRKKKPTASIPHKSRKEAQVHQCLNQLLPEAEYIDNGYYSWLMSPKGYPLQLDRYYPSLNLAFEVQGRQHYQFSEIMHTSQDAFKYLQKCDKLKVKLCKQRGVRLLIIRYDRKISKEYLIRRLTEEKLLSKLRRLTEVDD